MAFDLTSGIVRILKPDSGTAGTGFVVTDDGLIVTCAHVVEAAGTEPGDIVRVDFHATREERKVRVEPDWWRPAEAKDVAILRLEGPLPEGVTPLLLGSSRGTSGHPFKTFGFPDASPEEGIWGDGHILEATQMQGVQVLQLSSPQITPGFSGAPVLDTVTRRVVGMVTAITAPDRYQRLAETAFITPTETLQAACPDLRLSDLCPYRGLAAFTEADSEFFFGRKGLVADLVAHLRGNPRFLAVVGPSGSGKSSVVQAGLFPALRRGEVPSSGTWHLLTLRPGADPFAALASAGLGVSPEGDLWAAIRAFLDAHPEAGRLVFFTDQFEELFALCSDSVRERLLDDLLVLLEGRGGRRAASALPVTVILALRADFYGHLLRYRSLSEWLKVGQVNVSPMRKGELRAVMEEPARKVGLRFEPGLVTTIVEDAGRGEYSLPLLEVVLTELWEQREEGVLTHAAYHKIGRMAGVISQRAEDTYSGLGAEDRRLAQRIFTRLVYLGGERMANSRQRRTLAELVARREEREAIHRLVKLLADTRLLVTDWCERAGDATVDIVHDALLREWGRLGNWLDEDREFLLGRQRLQAALAEWERTGRDEGVLLRGAPLAEAKLQMNKRFDDLNPAEQNFIQESMALREREERQRQELLERLRRQEEQLRLLSVQRIPEPRPIDVLRQATKQFVGPLAQTLTGEPRKPLRQSCLTQASKLPHANYLDTALLEGEMDHLARLDREVRILLEDYRIERSRVQLEELEQRAQRLGSYLSRIYQLEEGDGLDL